LTNSVVSPINGLEFAPEWAGTPIHFRCAPVADFSSSLWPEECGLVDKSVQIRRNTFSTGRHCAREVLKAVGCAPSALLRNADGSIDWPAGFIGSVSHTNDWAVAGVAVQGLSSAVNLGIDLERVRPLGKAVLKHISTQAERDNIHKSDVQTWHATALFGLKESIYKCLRTSYGSFIRFHDVEIRDIASGRPRLVIVNPSLRKHCDSSEIELRLAVTSDHVFSLAWRRQAAQE